MRAHGRLPTDGQTNSRNGQRTHPDRQLLELKRMNLAALASLIAGIVIMLSSIPLIRRKVPMNFYYGVRIPAAFESDEHWYDINEYGGRLFLLWGVLIVLLSGLGFATPKQHWKTFSILALIPIIGGVALVVVQVLRYARKRSDQAL